MVQKSDGMTYAPKGTTVPVVAAGGFRFAVMHLDHGHIYGMCNGLLEAGGELAMVYDTDPARIEVFLKSFPASQGGDR